MELIDSITLANNTNNSITFSNLPNDGTDLLIYMSLRALDNEQFRDFTININNGESSPIQFPVRATNSVGDETRFIYVTARQNENDQTFTSGWIYIPNYAKSQKHVGFIQNAGFAGDKSFSEFLQFYHNVASPISTFTIQHAQGGNIMENSKMQVYKI